MEATAEDLCIESPLAARPASSGMGLEVPGTSTGILKTSPTGTGTPRKTPDTPASDNSSDSSVVCLDMFEQKPTKKPELGEIATQDLKEFEEEVFCSVCPIDKDRTMMSFFRKCVS